MGIEFFKYSALGNDYLVIDPLKNKVNLTGAIIRRICDRNFGVGSDGVLYGPEFKNGEIVLRIFNPDGGEAEKSGSGLRIFARYLREQGYVESPEFEVMTKGGKVHISILNSEYSSIKVDMGTVSFLSSKIPVNGIEHEVIREEIIIDQNVLQCTCLTIGNPHCVVEIPEISKELAHRMGPLLENSTLFPNRINVQFMKVIDTNNIQIEIWERGAGYTLASGTSSCAAASAAFRLGLTDNHINAHMPGGVIDVEIDNNGHVFMTGNVDSIFKGELSSEFQNNML